MRPSPTAALAALLLAALICAPVLADPTGLALGHPHTDTWNHVWGYQHVAEALRGEHALLYTEALGGGGTLWFIDLFQAIALAPVTWVAGPIAAYNLGVLLNLWLAAFAAWGLSHALTRDPVASLVPAVVLCLSPTLVVQVHNGISEGLSIGWIPLSAWGLLRWRRDPSHRRGLAAGVALALAAWASWYQGLFALMLAPALLFPSANASRLGRRHLASGALLLGTWAALVLPAGLAFRATLAAPDALVLRDPERVWTALVSHNAVDLMAFVHAGSGPDLSVFDEALQVSVFLGLSLLVPAFAARRIPQARPWLLAASLCLLMALGPFLRISGGPALLPGGAPIPLPFLAANRLLPGFGAISHAYRFVVPGLLALGLAAGMLAAKRPIWLLALPLWVVESSAARTLPLPTASGALPAVYAALPDDGRAVLDLPMSRQVLERSEWAWYSSVHGHPTVYGLNDPTPPKLRENALVRAVLARERSVVTSLAPSSDVWALEGARRELVGQDVGWIVVHLDPLPPPKQRSIRALLDAVCGPGEEIDGAVLYAL